MGYIHPDSQIGKYVTIGYGTRINGPITIKSHKDAPVTIGRYCAIAYNVRIRARNHHTGYANLLDRLQNIHGFPSLDSLKGPVNIGNNVWLADNVIILSGVTIGDGAVIGAGSVVVRDIPPYAIAVGNPAKVVKYRFSDSMIEQMLQIKWWEWDQAKIARNKVFFGTDLSSKENVNLYELIVE